MLRRAGTIADEIAKAKSTIPDAKFVVLANEESELIELQAHGIFSILANASMFVDERVFRPITGMPVRYEAIYNAALHPYKNHHLCKNINDLALVYYVLDRSETTEAYGRQIRELLRGATFLNDTQGQYRKLSYDEIAEANSQSSVGLCLSTVEGVMRAAMEYLLCGTPVVSVPSLGGRQRYLHQGNSIFTRPDPESVALAVKRLGQRNLSRASIRNGALSILNFERANLLRALNHLVLREFGQRKYLKSFEPLREAWTYRSFEDWERYLKEFV
ncbi:MAG: glycosyltransferase [Rhizobiales bacterium]|nr:glycosyltransferase [Hyphomicrobiales bacterium]